MKKSLHTTDSKQCLQTYVVNPLSTHFFPRLQTPTYKLLPDVFSRRKEQGPKTSNCLEKPKTCAQKMPDTCQKCFKQLLNVNNRKEVPLRETHHSCRDSTSDGASMGSTIIQSWRSWGCRSKRGTKPQGSVEAQNQWCQKQKRGTIPM